MMSTELKSTATTTASEDDKSISVDTSTRQNVITDKMNQKWYPSIGDSQKLCDVKVVLSRLEVANIVPLPGGVGFSVPPLSAVINPVNKNQVPGIGNYPARRAKRNADVLACCVGCTSGKACKKVKSSEEQLEHGCAKNLLQKRKYVKRKKQLSKLKAGNHQQGASQHQVSSRSDGFSGFSDSRCQAAASSAGEVHVIFSPATSTVCSPFVAVPGSSTCPISDTASPATATCSAPTAINNTGVFSLQESHLSPLPLKQPYIGAIPLYASPPPCPVYLPFAGQQPGNLFIPGIHDSMHCSPVYPLMQYCMLRFMSDSSQAMASMTNVALGDTCTFNSHPLAANFRHCAPFEPQIHCGKDHVASCNTIASQPESNVGNYCSTSIGHPKDHIGTGVTNIAQPKDHIGTGVTNIAQPKDRSLRTGTRVGFQRDSVGCHNTSDEHQSNFSASANDQSTFSISSLLPDLPSELDSTGNETHTSQSSHTSWAENEQEHERRTGRYNRKNVGAFSSRLERSLAQVTKRDVADYRWLVERYCCTFLSNSAQHTETIAGAAAMKKFIKKTEEALKFEKRQSERLCWKLLQEIHKYKKSADRYSERYKITLDKIRAAENNVNSLRKNSQRHDKHACTVEELESEYEELNSKMKSVMDEMASVQEKWFISKGTYLCENTVV